MSTRVKSKSGLTCALLCWFGRCSYRNHWSLLKVLPRTQYRESTYDHLWVLGERKYQFVHGKGYEELVVSRTGGTGVTYMYNNANRECVHKLTATWSERCERFWSNTVACRIFKSLLCNTTQFVLFWTSIWICTEPLKLRSVRLGCRRRR